MRNIIESNMYPMPFDIVVNMIGCNIYLITVLVYFLAARSCMYLNRAFHILPHTQPETIWLMREYYTKL